MTLRVFSNGTLIIYPKQCQKTCRQYITLSALCPRCDYFKCQRCPGPLSKVHLDEKVEIEGLLETTSHVSCAQLIDCFRGDRLPWFGAHILGANLIWTSNHNFITLLRALRSLSLRESLNNISSKQFWSQSLEAKGVLLLVQLVWGSDTQRLRLLKILLYSLTFTRERGGTIKCQQLH